ncbi:MAG: YdbL family protein [Magnetococcales bacterium]|nr:YdbL family protein [Magnetococcales bacterium]
MGLSRLAGGMVGLLTMLLAACVTVNVYFPAPAVDQAAQRIVREVWSGMKPPESSMEEKKTPENQPVPAQPREKSVPERQSLRSHSLLVIVNAVLSWTVPSAAAADLDVSSPAIRDIAGRLKNRAGGALKPFLFGGQVGINRDGDLEIRSEEGLPLQQKGALRSSVREDNIDRAQLYREIAVANGHPEWEADIRARFALKWVSEAPAGWAVQKPDGSWVKK